MKVLLGEVGTGKTLLSHVFSKIRNPEGATGLLLNPVLSPLELVHELADEFEVTADSCSLRDNLLAIENRLASLTKAGRSALFIIDEAQCLPALTLETVQKLFAYAQSSGLALHVVLMGQPEFLSRSSRLDPDPMSLLPLTLSDLKTYISKRIGIAGGNGFAVFEQSALGAIYGESNGLPRLINRICELTLLSAEQEKARCINKRTVLKALSLWPQLPLGISRQADPLGGGIFK